MSQWTAANMQRLWNREASVSQLLLETNMDILKLRKIANDEIFIFHNCVTVIVQGFFVTLCFRSIIFPIL